MARSHFLLFFFVFLKYGDCGPFFTEKKSFGQFAAPIGDDSPRRLQRMFSSAASCSNVLERLVKSPD
jgi:hypothetical protein